MPWVGKSMDRKAARRRAEWNGLCPAGKHGLDFEGQQCDMCKPIRLEPPDGSQWQRIEPPCCDTCDRPAKWKHPLGGLRCWVCPKPGDGAP